MDQTDSDFIFNFNILFFNERHFHSTPLPPVRNCWPWSTKADTNRKELPESPPTPPPPPHIFSRHNSMKHFKNNSSELVNSSYFFCNKS